MKNIETNIHEDLCEALDQEENSILTRELCEKHGLDTSFWDYLDSLPADIKEELGC